MHAAQDQGDGSLVASVIPLFLAADAEKQEASRFGLVGHRAQQGSRIRLLCVC